MLFRSAGVGQMNYLRFQGFNVLGAILWVSIFISGGYLFGNLPLVRDNFGLVTIAIIGVSFVPVVYVLLRERVSR